MTIYNQLIYTISMEEEKRKLIKFSNYSLCVTLPKPVVTRLNWKKGDLVNLEIDSGKIIITGDKKKNTNQTPISKSKSKSEKLRW